MFTSNALGLVVSNTYDAIGRKIRETFSSDGTWNEWHYDPDGVRTQIDRLGRATTYTYTPEGWLERVTDPLGRTTRYGYDAAGNRTHVTNAMGDVTEYTYDAAGNPIFQNCNGFILTNAFNKLSQNTTSRWAGTVTVLGWSTSPTGW